LSKIIAPFVPFISEKIYRSLDGGESVHLCDYPVCNEEKIDDGLERKMDKVREMTEVVHSLRAKKGIKLRYPLSVATILTSEDISSLANILKEEINVKELKVSGSIDQFTESVVKPNYSSLGPKFKDRAGQIASMIEKIPSEKIKGAKLRIDGKEYVLSEEDYLLEEKEKEGFAIGEKDGEHVILCTEQTPELIAEGFSREIVRRVQEMRKGMNLDMDDKIIVTINIDNNRVSGREDYIETETRSKNLLFGDVSGDAIREWNIDGEKIIIGIKKV